MNWRRLIGLKPRPVEPARRYSMGPVAATDQLFAHLLSRTSGAPIGRQAALEVGAVVRGRNTICSIATLPLAEYGMDRRTVASALLQQIDPNVPNVVTLAQTVEDLVFEAIAWWRVLARGHDRYPTACQRIDPARVSLNPPKGKTVTPDPLPSGVDPRGAVIWVDGHPVPAADMIRFDSPNPAFLTTAARVIRVARLLDDAAATYARNPRPLDYFTDSETSPEEPTDDEWLTFLAQWEDRRRETSTARVPGWAKYEQVETVSPRELQLVELQQRAALEIANHLGIDGEEVGVSTTSRTYFNAVDRRQTRVNETYAAYLRAIADRLSMGDVTRRGYRVDWNLRNYMKADPTTRAAFYREMHGLGVMDVAAIAEEEGLPMPLTPVEPDARPDPATVEAAGDPAQWTFDQPAAGRTFAFTGADHEFSVDRETRTITGLAVPYNVVTHNWGRAWRFKRGSLHLADGTPVRAGTDMRGRVKHLIDHGEPIGKVLRHQDRPDGMYVTMSVARGERGDWLLSMAQDGVYDGLSVGVDFSEDPAVGDIRLGRDGVADVLRATWRETSTTAMPAYDDARVTAVAASRTAPRGPLMDETAETTAAETAAPAAAPETPAPAADITSARFTAAEWSALAEFAAGRHPAAAPPAADGPTFVDPRRQVASTTVNEALPYRFSYTPQGRSVFAADAEHDFSTDLFALVNGASRNVDVSAQRARVDAMIRAAFADVETADVTALNPNRHRPDMWVPQRDLATPLWDMVAAGTTDGSKFDIPKFTSASGLVVAATEKTEPAGGSFVAELQTVTPTQVWGKVEITRQAWRAGGNPAMSAIIWDQMLREYYEDREAAVATFLATLTAAADIALTGTPATTPDNDDDRVTVRELEAALAVLQFARGGRNIRAFAVHEALFRVLARVTDSAGRPLYPIINPSNANGASGERFSYIDVAGVRAIGAAALGSVGTASTNSWLFDPATVRGWASAPERLFWDFGATVQTANIPQLSFVTLGIYGDIAFGNTDINGVRQVTFDPSV